MVDPDNASQNRFLKEPEVNKLVRRIRYDTLVQTGGYLFSNPDISADVRRLKAEIDAERRDHSDPFNGSPASSV